MGLRRGVAFFPPRDRRSIPLIAIQPPISTIHCNCLYSLANSVVCSYMLSSSNPQISSSIHLTPVFSLASSTSFTTSASFTSSTSLFCFTQTLPTFSTPSKHRTHSNACNSIPFIRLLHTSRHTGGGGYPLDRKPLSRSPTSSRSNSQPAIPISALSLFSFFSLFAAKCTKLTPLFSYLSALFQKECLPKPFAIKLFRTLCKTPGVWGHIFQTKRIGVSLLLSGRPFSAPPGGLFP